MSDENWLIDEQDAKKVLERALELDEARQGSMSVEQLRAVARDMSISPASIDRALEEHIASQAMTPSPEQPRGFRRVSSVWMAAIFVILALFILVAIKRVVPTSPP
ncbi:MAG TPA: hypothetical protein VH559_04785 [Gemmatimonadaceae bacterium]|jgi:hypothetical protein